MVFDLGFTSKFKLETYTFAAPTVGKISFVSTYHSQMTATGSESHRCVNNKDVVPYAWAGLPNIISENIPTTVPPLVAAGVNETAHDYLKDSVIYKHVETVTVTWFLRILRTAAHWEKTVLISVG